MPKISALPNKATPVDADSVVTTDSQDSNASKNVSIGSISTKVNASASHIGASTFSGDLTVDTDKFFVDQSTGNVGIGTASPVAQGLHIKHATQPEVSLGTPANDEGFIITFNNSDSIIGNKTNTPLRVFANNAEAMRIEAAGNVIAGADNTLTLGSASKRWSEVFAGNATINTSDAREKTEVSIEDKVLDAGDAISIKGFKWNSAIELKGDGARVHYGVFAQEVKAAFEAQGLVAEEYSLLCYDEWDDKFDTVVVEKAILDEDGNVTTPAVTEQVLATPAGNRYGVRYEELMALKVACLERKIEALG